MPSPNQQLQVEFQKKALAFGVWRSCLNCQYWRQNALGASVQAPPGCVKFNVMPPLDVIVVGCTEWLPHLPF